LNGSSEALAEEDGSSPNDVCCNHVCVCLLMRQILHQYFIERTTHYCYERELAQNKKIFDKELVYY